MSLFQKSINHLLSHKKYLFFIISLFLFIIIASVTYLFYLRPKLTETYVANKEFVDKNNDSSSADLYFFFTEWCPHCKTAKPIWKELKKKYKDKLVNNTTRINFIDVNCENDTATADKFKITGYPTIKLVYKNKIIEYDAKPDLDVLDEFINESIKD